MFDNVKQRLTGFILVILAVAMPGCFSSNVHTGCELDAQKVERIQKEKTTTSELIGWFGTPSSKGVLQDGTETLTFSSMDNNTSFGGPFAIFGFGSTKTNNQMKTLSIWGKNGIVTNYIFDERQQ